MMYQRERKKYLCTMIVGHCIIVTNQSTKLGLKKEKKKKKKTIGKIGPKNNGHK